MMWMTITKTAGGFLRGNWKFLFKWLILGGLGVLLLFTFKGFVDDYIEDRNHREQELLEVTTARDRAIIEADRSKAHLMDQQAFRSALDNVRREVSKQQEALSKIAEDQQRIFREHDLENLARKKPGLIERRVNEASKARIDSIEEALNETE